MNKRGFSLMELLIVIALIGILVSAAAFGFSQYSKKSKIEGQTRALYGNLMEYRAKALYEKKSWTIKIPATGERYEIYSSPTTSVAPVTTVYLKYNIETNNFNDIVFNSQGLSNASGISGKSICVSSPNDAVFDSVVVSETRVRIGKKGANCAANNINAQ